MGQESLFSFKVTDDSDYNFDVVYFKGTEELGELYSYEIDLVSNSEIDIDVMLKSDVYLVIYSTEEGVEDTYVHGVLSNFEMLQEIDSKGSIHYKAYLVPKLWRLTLSEYQQVFTDKSIIEILSSILTYNTLKNDSDFKFSLTNLKFYSTDEENYQKKEYVCQYKESNYDFFKRWMEREGLYFYFKQDSKGCMLTITDANSESDETVNLISYKETQERDQFISSLVYRSKKSIDKVSMRNYNYNHPDSPMNSDPFSDEYYPNSYLFGNSLLEQKQLSHLSKINLQKAKCLKNEMFGNSNIDSLKPGYIYTLENYFKTNLNQDYLMIRVDSEGYQKHDGIDLKGLADTPLSYSNTFTMIPSDTQFRSQTSIPWPYIGGMLSAKIDGSDDKTAFLDKYGRYKVIMPFDVSDDVKEMKASAYIRMAQSSGGKTDEGITQGIHFPLHKGTEVLLSFVDGDPDQPVIMGAVPNIDSPSPVNEDNLETSIIRSHAGNTIEMNDSDIPYIQLGISDDEGDPDNYIKISGLTEEDKEEDGIELETEGKIEMHAKGDVKKFWEGSEKKGILGNKLETIAGATEEFVFGDSSEVVVGMTSEAHLLAMIEIQMALGLEYATVGMHKIAPIEKELNAIKNTITDENTEATGTKKERFLKFFGYKEDVTEIGSKLTRMVREITEIAENVNTIVDAGSVKTTVTLGSVQTKVTTGSVKTKVTTGSVKTNVEGGDVETNVGVGNVKTDVEAGIVNTTAPWIFLEGKQGIGLDTEWLTSSAELYVFE